MKGNNSPKLYIKVECDNNGYWTFWTRLDSEDEYTKEKQIKDNSIQNSSCCGIYCIYTQTRSKGITFHHVQLSNDVETTTKPDGTPDEPDTPADPIPVPPDYPAEVKGILLFNEVMYDNATDGAEYIELYNPSGSTVKTYEIYRCGGEHHNHQVYRYPATNGRQSGNKRSPLRLYMPYEISRYPYQKAQDQWRDNYRNNQLSQTDQRRQLSRYND